MINKQLIHDVMSRHSDYRYELKTVNNQVEFMAEKGTWKPPGSYSRRIRKVLTSEDDVKVLEMVLSNKDG